MVKCLTAETGLWFIGQQVSGHQMWSNLICAQTGLWVYWSASQWSSKEITRDSRLAFSAWKTNRWLVNSSSGEVEMIEGSFICNVKESWLEINTEAVQLLFIRHCSPLSCNSISSMYVYPPPQEGAISTRTAITHEPLSIGYGTKPGLFFQWKFGKNFLAIKNFSVNETMSGQPNKHLIHWHFEN